MRLRLHHAGVVSNIVERGLVSSGSITDTDVIALVSEELGSDEEPLVMAARGYC